MNWDKLAKDMPGFAKALADMMVKEAIPIMRSSGFADIAFPSVSITFESATGEKFCVILGVESNEDDGDTDEDEDFEESRA